MLFVMLTPKCFIISGAIVNCVFKISFLVVYCCQWKYNRFLYADLCPATLLNLFISSGNFS